MRDCDSTNLSQDEPTNLPTEIVPSRSAFLPWRTRNLRYVHISSGGLDPLMKIALSSAYLPSSRSLEVEKPEAETY